MITLRTARRSIASLLILAATTLCAVADECVEATSIANEATPASVSLFTIRDSAEWARMPWVKQLIANGFMINQPGVNYPKFARFCVKVYNWGDRVFNSYDPEYVVGTGKNWKAMIKNYNWAETYAMFFDLDTRLGMQSGLYSDLGPSINFMAVSINPMWKVSEYFHNTSTTRHNFRLSFTCSRFQANFAKVTTTGGLTINRFGDYKKHHLSESFDGSKTKMLSGDVYYFFNNRKYSHAAAYCFSKYQLKSAGSWMLGLSIVSQRIFMDFSELPEEMMDYLPSLKRQYNFHHVDYDICGGYAHNWVLRPKVWLINLTLLPSLGYKHSYQDSSYGSKSMFSTNFKGMFSVVYNHRALFANLNAMYEAYVSYGNGSTFYNSIESLALSVGVRF